MDFARQQRNPGRHVVGFGIVLGMHLLLGYGLVTGLAQRMVDVLKAPITTKIIEEVKPPPPPPDNLPPPPKLPPPPPPFVPPPEVVVAAPPAPAPTITVVQTPPPPPAPVVIAPPPPVAPPPPPPPPRVAARPAIGNVQSCAPKSDDYPVAALRVEAVGTTKIRFTIGPEGKLQKSEVVRSAGSSREHKLLDRVALAKLGECAFKPGIDENGKPVGGSFEVEYVWKIE